MTHTTTAQLLNGPARARQGTRGWPRKLGRWVLKGFIGVAALVVALIGSGVVYQAAATELDRRAYVPVGRLVDVGGYQMHINCIGTGSPTVVLESAFPGTSANWGWVQSGVAEATRVCTYDRAGMGWSDARSEPRDARHIAADLHALLKGGDVPGPYVLVGHSFGGLLVREYAAQYPLDVAGVVLVDAMHPDQYNRFPPEMALPDAQQLDTLLILAQLGLTRLWSPFPTPPTLPDSAREQTSAFNASMKSMTAMANEYRGFPSTFEQIRAAGDLGSTPLFVLTAEETFPHSAVADRVWKELQNELAALSTNSTHRHTTGTTHDSLVYLQEDAQTTTTTAILQFVSMLRSAQR
jgi:pimeloyl-ACP methyl ester carboxylesterase